ncbi:diguanylate cyclase (GGDEF) domain-containing protein [Nostoc sp. PCC 7524]|nr:diguanylate cyclase (GGDEF) domain-containing protein [Nostoc sp. PCC 7524]
MPLIKLLENKPKSFSIILSIFLVCIIGLIDCYISPDISISFIYLVPIGIATWFADKYIGLLISVFSDVIIIIANQTQEQQNLHPFIHYWNGLVTLAFFLFANYLLAELKSTLKHLETLAQTDNLTGLTNRRFFLEIVNSEIEKSCRHEEPLTLAYVDIDDFKKINDKFGHGFGDRLLQSLANSAKSTLRKIDVIARMGGDEFAILLPRTDYDAAEVVLHRVQKVLSTSMREQGLSVTVSIGAITFSHPPQSVGKIIDKADSLMYTAKKKGKNLLQHELLEKIEI